MITIEIEALEIRQDCLDSHIEYTLGGINRLTSKHNNFDLNDLAIVENALQTLKPFVVEYAQNRSQLNDLYRREESE